MEVLVTALVLLLLAIALLLRILPHRIAADIAAVDHWYWKSYIETYRQNRRFPPVLPKYLLDDQQWYPPAFPLLMAALPDVFFAQYSFWISIGIDLMRMALLLGVTAWLTGGDSFAIVATAVMYATTPILISYNIQLNPRGLGALFLDGLILLLVWILFFGGPLWVWLLVLILAGAILLTHKMTTQLFWFLCLAGALVLPEWRLLALIPGSIAAALCMSRGFYWNVLKAHWDIVSFWNRNWRWLQAHLIRESPIYGEPGYETPTKFHRRGIEGIVRHLRYLFGFSPGMWVLVALWLGGGFNIGQTPLIDFTEGWVVATLLFALLTVFVPFCKCLGSGYYYLYNAAFPGALLTGLLGHGSVWSSLAWAGVAAAAGSNLLGLTIYYVQVRRRAPGIDQKFDEIIAYLQTLPRGVVMCLPFQWSEIVAYKTKHSVLWGAHGYGFRRLEPLFPRLMLPVREIINRYQVQYLIAQRDYLPESFLTALPHQSGRTFEGFRVFHAKS